MYAGIVPHELKIAYVIPILKKSDVQLPSNYNSIPLY